MARWGGATVVGTVRTGADLDAAAGPAVALDQPDPAAAIRAHAPDGVDRVVEVPFSDNADLDAAVVKHLGIIAAYPTRDDRPGFPFWPMLFDNVTIRLLGRDDFPASAEQQAADLTAAARESHHMRVLTDAGLLAREQRGKWAYYRVIPGALESLSAALAGLS